jgi:N-6 DNA Methylase
MTNAGPFNLRVEIQSYGVSSRSFRDFGGGVSSELLDYLDLLQWDDDRHPARGSLMPDGVAESQGRPLLFVVNESRLAQVVSERGRQIKTLRRKLACRGDRAYLACIRPGELAVVPVSLDDRDPDWKLYTPGTPEALTFFSRLSQGHYDGEGEPKEADYIFSAMFKLVWSVADRLATLKLKRTDVLSLMGRALFFRFLRDRKVVRESDCQSIAPKAATILDCFANAQNSAHTSAWLDKTFNGDLLPLTEDGRISYFEGIGQRTGGRVFTHLSAILKGEEPSGDSGWQIPLPFGSEERSWGTYDFAHVPVGLLSQVYERFAWKWEHQTAQETSVHYTPRNIAATLVDEAFAKLPNAHEARVLDPACGASVFLVLAFRRLYQERWKETKQRPDTKAIREILNRQLTGFDISDSAIKLAALSLYLTAIELDPKPVPPEKLKFNKLRNQVLFNFRREGIDSEEGAVAGSLGKHVGRRFDGRFDLVVSNPPWTSLKGKEPLLADEFNRLSKAIIARRADEATAAAYENPDFGPDLPFVWKATEWCKPDGRIAMALPARILLKQEDIPRRAREIFLRLIEVTGIINGTNLSDTAVWPKMGQPFMILFARNRRPKAGHVLRFITPQYDKSVNRNGEMRIDPKSVQPIEVDAMLEQPWIWKALTVGTSLDVDVLQRLKAAGGRPLQVYWEEDLKLMSSNGYSLKKNPVEPQDPKQKKKYLDLIKYLHGLRDLNSTGQFDFIVDPGELDFFKHEKVGRPRQKEVYQAPLVLIDVSPTMDRKRGRSLLSLSDVAFNESFYGYSAAQHHEGALLARYVQLFVHSNIWAHYLLLVSPEFGAERRKFQKSDLDECPIIPWEQLTPDQKRQVVILSNELEQSDANVFDKIDSFFGNLFGLDSKDMEVVRDTVEVAMPYRESRDRACNSPSLAERERFRKRLESVLRPFFKVTGDDLQVELWNPDQAVLQISAPFSLLLISKRGTTTPAPDDLFREVLLKLAEDTGSTRIIQQIEGGLLVALLNQYRYWTPSRARLLGADLAREYLDVCDA